MTTTKERNVNLQVKCVICQQIHTLKVAEEDAYEYLASPNRRHVQDIFPYLNSEERELLISGVCPTCWNNMFACDDDEEDSAMWDYNESDLHEDRDVPEQ